MSKEFAVNIIQLCEQLRQQGKAVAIVNQLLRSGTSIGANIHEGNYAASKMDFINKFQIALKECYETEYWLEIFRDSGIMDNVAYEHMYAYCAKLRKLLTASVRTAKENQTKENL